MVSYLETSIDPGKMYLCTLGFLIIINFFVQVGASSVVPVRWLNLQEFQSKKLMADNGLHVQRCKVAENAKEAVEIAKELSE